MFALSIEGIEGIEVAGDLCGFHRHISHVWNCTQVLRKKKLCCQGWEGMVWEPLKSCCISPSQHDNIYAALSESEPSTAMGALSAFSWRQKSTTTSAFTKALQSPCKNVLSNILFNLRNEASCIATESIQE